MRLLIFFLLLLFHPLGLTRLFGDENQTEDWLPIPDGFVWPQGIADFEPKDAAFASLEPSLQEALKSCWPDKELPAEVSFFLIDLNGDNKSEVFFHIQSLSGTGGPFYEIVTYSVDKYVSVGGIQGVFKLLPVKNGWFEIEEKRRGGGGQYTRYLRSYDGEKYGNVRTEHHDFNHGKVTVYVTPPKTP